MKGRLDLKKIKEKEEEKLKKRVEKKGFFKVLLKRVKTPPPRG